MRTLFLTMVACLFATATQAKYSGGSGTAADPYQIWTAEQMNTIGTDPNDWNKHFRLMADIDLAAYTGTQFNSIGRWFGPKDPNTRAFTGVFDGNGKVIRHFTWTSTGGNAAGLFAYVARDGNPRPAIMHLGLEDVNICAENASCVGALAAVADNAGVTDCYMTGSVRGGYTEVWQPQGVGGLIGYSHECTVEKCYAAATVGGIGSVGGLVGRQEHEGGTMRQCYSRGSVSGEGAVGGLAGYAGGDTECCYSESAVTGQSGVGGLVGTVGSAGLVRCSYARGVVTGTTYVGGLVAYIGASTWEEGEVIDSYWDVQTSGQAKSDGGTGKTTAEMQAAATFQDWWTRCDELPIWTIDEGEDYPRLWWEHRPGGPLNVPVAPFSSFLAGSGTPEDPYLILTAEELNQVAFGTCEQGKHLKLMADIDLAGYPGASFHLIDNFDGVFDGNGHSISNFRYRGKRTHSIGLFGSVLSGEIKSLGLIDPNVEGTAIDVGALAGLAEACRITDCYVRGGKVSGGTNVGALVGRLKGGVLQTCRVNGCGVLGNNCVGGLAGCLERYYEEFGNAVIDGDFVLDSSAVADVRGTRLSSCLGGLIGVAAWSEGTIISDCRAGGAVTGGDGSRAVGGLLGSSACTITCCYASTIVTVGSGSADIGGLIGYGGSNKATNCYATGPVVAGNNSKAVGGLVGNSGFVARFAGEVRGSFWDTNTSGQKASAGGTGKTTAQMQTAATFVAAGWDFVGPSDGPHDIWAMPEGGGYPILWHQLPPQAALPAFSGGTGDPCDPFLIASAADLNLIGHNPRLMACHFRLIHDVDLAQGTSYPIGDESHPFVGTFDGGGRTISNLTSSGSMDYYTDYRTGAGMFAVIEGVQAEVRRLGLVNPTVRGGGYAGALVGWLRAGRICNCYATGGRISGGSYSGGLVGQIWEPEDLPPTPGSATVVNCYATCAVAAWLPSGLVGGFGDACEQVTGSFFDVQTSGRTYSHGGTGKTTAEMQMAKTFLDAGWDFVGETANGTEDVWWIDEGKDYPRLWWEAAPE